MTQPRPHIASMAAYALARTEVPDGKPLVSLSQNESLRGPSPKAVDAASKAACAAAFYPDPDWSGLRQALAAHHRIDAEAILCGNGSLDLIGSLARVYASPARAVLAPAHAYPFFKTASQMADARFDTAPERDARVDVNALLSAVRPDTGLVFIANPGNPTGTRIPKADLIALREGLRGDILLVIDEAYGEFADHLHERCFDMVAGGNTVILRTFSKAYGLAGFRAGWGYFPAAIAAELRKVMNPNNLSGAAQAAAIAAIEDQAYMAETCRLTAKHRDRAVDLLQGAGFKTLPSFTNFILIDLHTSKAVQSVDAALRAEGIVLRPQGGAGLPQMLRMTVGPENAMCAAIDILTAWKKEAQF